MAKSNVGKMLKLSKEKNKSLGDILILKVSDSGNQTAFKEVEYCQDGIKSASFRITKPTAKLLVKKINEMLK